MSAFTWMPDYEPREDSAPKASTTQFGDGYQQRQANGLNSDLKVWNLNFSVRDNAEAAAIKAFLEARAGVESFDWTPPLDTTARKFVCNKWSHTPVRFNNNTIAATFEEVAEP
jgi:phage-related protein